MKILKLKIQLLLVIVILGQMYSLTTRNTSKDEFSDNGNVFAAQEEGGFISPAYANADIGGKPVDIAWKPYDEGRAEHMARERANKIMATGDTDDMHSAIQYYGPELRAMGLE